MVLSTRPGIYPDLYTKPHVLESLRERTRFRDSKRRGRQEKPEGLRCKGYFVILLIVTWLTQGSRSGTKPSGFPSYNDSKSTSVSRRRVQSNHKLLTRRIAMVILTVVRRTERNMTRHPYTSTHSRIFANAASSGTTIPTY